jgi:hypothetical protein
MVEGIPKLRSHRRDKILTLTPQDWELKTFTLLHLVNTKTFSSPFFLVFVMGNTIARDIPNMQGWTPSLDHEA